MEGWMNSFFRVINKVLSIIGGTALSLMMFMTVADVIMRSGGHPILGTYEMVALLLAVVIGFTIPMVSLGRGHVYMEIVLDKLSVRNKALMVCSRLSGTTL
jgi:TRAP-type C4-dicarboxylate transport system permease small subunit